MEESNTQIEDEPEEDKYANETKWKKFHRKMFLEDQVPWQTQVRQVLFPHWYTINWLLLFSPIGIAIHFVKGINPLAPFIINFIAIVPLAGILSFATEEIALRVGEVLGGLLNASFGQVLMTIELLSTVLTQYQKRCRVDCQYHCSDKEGNYYRANIPHWQYAVQLIARHGNVFLLWWSQSRTTVF